MVIWPFWPLNNKGKIRTYPKGIHPIEVFLKGIVYFIPMLVVGPLNRNHSFFKETTLIPSHALT